MCWYNFNFVNLHKKSKLMFSPKPLFYSFDIYLGSILFHGKMGKESNCVAPSVMTKVQRKYTLMEVFCLTCLITNI